MFTIQIDQKTITIFTEYMYKYLDKPENIYMRKYGTEETKFSLGYGKYTFLFNDIEIFMEFKKEGKPFDSSYCGAIYM